MRIDCDPVRGSAAAGFTPRAQITLLSCACAGASAFLFLVDPTRHAVYPQCLFHRVTGLYCAGCGATRAAYALLHGRVWEALHDNALFMIALPVFLAIVGSYLALAWRKNAWPRLEINPEKVALYAAGVFMVMMAFMIVRNFPGFEILRPLG